MRSWSYGRELELLLVSKRGVGNGWRVSTSEASQSRYLDCVKMTLGAHTSESACRWAAVRATLAWSVKLETLDWVEVQMADDGRTMRRAIGAVPTTRLTGGQRQHRRSSSRWGREYYRRAR
jgi:hypothetical protein